jgi:hypothetical protein
MTLSTSVRSPPRSPRASAMFLKRRHSR